MSDPLGREPEDINFNLPDDDAPLTDEEEVEIEDAIEVAEEKKRESELDAHPQG